MRACQADPTLEQVSKAELKAILAYFQSVIKIIHLTHNALQ